MQFLSNGPDIPDCLLQAHEEGRVVFFCGAGISYPAGLPGFQGLVDKIFSIVGTTRNAIEQDAYQRSQFDATLDLLERRLPGQRLAVRRALMDALKPKLRRKGATDTHIALLQLARNREGAVRLVTTNFDRIFEWVVKHKTPHVSTYPAPMLPIPKNSRWNGLVYLHGLLPESPEESVLNRLVLTSGDFGLAYLTERWAARFVSDLFHNYVVCFVGYSINDPVLRYMMDALASDRMLGEVMPQAYALGDYESGQKATKTIEWEAKGVVPILYEVPTGTHNHSALHNTLKIWAETYRDGILGKERIVVDYAMARPSASTRQDDFVGRMLWALSHESGLPAKRFADYNPVPPIEWLDAFSEDRYRHGDLDRFGVPARHQVDDRLGFSLVRRPAPYTHAPWMSLVSRGATDSHWDEVMFQLARWLVRHLNDPTLILWFAQHGGQLHERWQWLIERELDNFSKLEREGNTTELENIRTNAPNAIPQPLMLILWRLLLTGRVKSPWHDLDLYHWKGHFARYGLTTSLRMEFRELLAPKITMKKPFHWDINDDETGTPVRLKQLIDWELVLATDDVYPFIHELREDSKWRDSLPLLFDDFQQLLRDALELLRELGEANDRSDQSYFDLPSISPHWQNRGFRDWVILIELLRDSWISIREANKALATQIALEWFTLPYPTFKRLAFFAASHDGCIPTDRWVNWLVDDDSWWLWSIETKRETMRLLIKQGTYLSVNEKKKLEDAILTGPPRIMYKGDIDATDWQDLVERTVWLRLAKLQSCGTELNQSAAQRLAKLTRLHPECKLATNERDEFSHWMSGTGDPDFEEERQIDLAPRKRRELVEWLKQSQQPSQRPYYGDNWREVCRTRFYHCAFALCDLAKENLWPTERWHEALQVWSEEGFVLRSWRFVAPLIQIMPSNVLLEIVHSVTWWLEVVSKSINRHEDILLDLSWRILDLPFPDDEETDQPVSKAINHPIGHITQGLINLWLNRKPNDEDKLPGDIEPFFTRLCEPRLVKFRHGRVLLASRLIALFRVDHPWTESHLLQFFEWENNPSEAKALWEGFLWSPRLYRPLLIALKTEFLNTAHHYTQLNEHRQQFAKFLTYAALDPIDTYASQDFQLAIGALPLEGLHESSLALVEALEGAGDQREGYWKNRIYPFWQQVWPKSRELAINGIPESLARLSIAAGGEFPSALTAVLDWLQPIEHPHYVVHRLHKSGLADRFPEDSLRLLDAIINNQPWAPSELGECLKSISQAKPSLLQDHRYQRLIEYFRRHGSS